MLFNSYIFLAAFLPAVLLVFTIVNTISKRAALGCVTAASLGFYGYWDIRFVPLICGSIAFNYAVGHAIGKYHRGWILAVGVAANLALIGFFKYSSFLFHVVAPYATPPDLLKSLVLPLGISFWTFQQIAYLVDVHRRAIEPAPLDAHAFSMLFFPHLIAGPILRYAVISRQYLRAKWPLDFLFRSFQVGVLIFAIGLFKKVAVADSLAPFADAAFKYSTTSPLSPSDAWIGSISYSLQLYFDFSGYSDMAYGLARMFGIRIPVNFYSPYKAVGILDFWRRWHMSLTGFFRAYVYLPLGGNRRGARRQIFNILVVFFLTGVWHGAGWTFFLWGLGHGVLVAIAHSWRRLAAPKLRAIDLWPLQFYLAHVSPIISRLATLFAVHFLWVLFRSPDFTGARYVFGGLLLHHEKWASVVYPELGLYRVAPALLAVVGASALLLPNTFEISRYVRRFSSEANGSLVHAAGVSAFLAFLLYVAVASIAKQQSTFLYYNF